MRAFFCWLGFHRGLYWIDARTGKVVAGNCWHCGKSRRPE